jgi:hypothetical protein
VTPAPRNLLLLVHTARVERVAEALRNAVGLTLRGDRVTVLLARGAPAPGHPRLVRAVNTLRALGHCCETAGSEVEVAAALRAADCVEVWT